jgi:single-stranded-DNA-specific exonuclease
MATSTDAPPPTRTAPRRATHWSGPGIDGPAPADALDAEARLARELSLPALLARILAARGVREPGQAAALLAPSMKALHDPELLPGCDLAAQRILQATDLGEPIAIYGDYDVDGITASAILFHTIRAVAPDADVRTYVPHRIREGYGINEAALRSLAEGGAKLIVSVDCGITAAGPAEVARELGVDLIITDHHNLPGENAVPDDDALEAPESAAPAHHTPGENGLPAAFALVHPRLRPKGAEPYPFGELCGAGVAFKLAWRLAVLHNGGERRVDEATRHLLLDCLALAALGTVADVVPLVDENRLIARFGLQRLKSTSLVGLSALLGAANLTNENVSAEDAGFKLAPRLNACGRMGTADEAVELLTTAGGGRASQIASSLEAQNRERRAEERRIFDEACALAEERGMTGPDSRAIVLAHEGWHAGVVGIVCSRLVDRFGIPALLAQRRDDGVCAGSGRGIDGFDLHAALSRCAEHLQTFGGHTMAAGFTARSECFDAFASALRAHAAGCISEELTRKRVRIDAEASIAELRSAETIDRLQTLGPFGRENPEPRLLVRGAVVRSAEPLGKHGAHAKLALEQPVTRGGGGGVARLIVKAWSRGELARELRPGDVVDAVLAAEINVWNGVRGVEARLIDLRPAR